MGRKYQVGRRFHRVKYVCAAAELAVIWVFHLLYQMLFPQLNPFLLGAGCAAAAVLIVFATLKLVNWCAAHLWYQVTEQGLQVGQGGKVTAYPWEDFRAAGIDNLNVIARFPVWFQMKNGRRLSLEQYVEGLGSLTLEILSHIEGHADVSDDLRERLKTAQALSGR